MIKSTKEIVRIFNLDDEIISKFNERKILKTTTKKSYLLRIRII